MAKHKQLTGWNHGVHLSGLSGWSQDIWRRANFCQDCQDMREKNDEKSRKSGYSGFSVSVVRIMSGYFHNLFPRPSHTKWSIPKFINVFQTCPFGFWFPLLGSLFQGCTVLSLFPYLTNERTYILWYHFWEHVWDYSPCIKAWHQGISIIIRNYKKILPP